MPPAFAASTLLYPGRHQCGQACARLLPEANVKECWKILALSSASSDGDNAGPLQNYNNLWPRQDDPSRGVVTPFTQGPASNSPWNVSSLSLATGGKPRLVLAPMEVLADARFRRAIGAVGGMDELVCEFIRVPAGSSAKAVRGMLRRRYDARELASHSLPVAAQIMGSDPGACGEAAWQLARLNGAPRVDLNCGCPSKRVNRVWAGEATSDPGAAELERDGAGASLLRRPERLYAVARAVVEAVRAAAREDRANGGGMEYSSVERGGGVAARGGISEAGCVASVKMRSGFEDTVLFDENVCAARDAGVGVLTVHGRTRAQGYAGAADWGKVRRAVELCRGHAVAVVGNGDCRSGADAARMVAETGCHGVMIGRGAVANPWVFWEARHALCGGDREAGRRTWAAEECFWRDYSGLGLTSATACAAASAAWCPKEHRQVVSRLEMLVRYAACVSDTDRGMLLRTHDVTAPVFLELLLSCVRRWYDAGNPSW